MDDGGCAAADRSGIPPREVSLQRHADQCHLLFLVLAFVGAVVGARFIRACILRGWRYADPHDRLYRDYRVVVAHLFSPLSRVRCSWPGMGIGYWNRH